VPHKCIHATIQAVHSFQRLSRTPPRHMVAYNPVRWLLQQPPSVVIAQEAAVDRLNAGLFAIHTTDGRSFRWQATVQYSFRVPGIHLLGVSRILSFTRDVRTQRSGKTSYPDAMQYISPTSSTGGSTAGQPRQSSQCEMSLCHYSAQSKTSDNFQHFGTSRHKHRTLRGWCVCKRMVK
jgi:hypothetical protein